ncbi:MAG: hypothetical protein HCA25_05830 [Dolichospermum sp. DET50]|nr:hypothetical protein [Dolichospermum sp. DET66]MBS3031812.1 hypothetical protein [Dolichospermum sp. DET67]MBS3037022.1 hypothetical protein [Dolichospermum sp. DET50]QSX69034.1 MAG: hypothetical protein EZY12_05000 [Dolichospermum sp. DET69]
MGKYSFSDEAIQDLEEICEYLGNRRRELLTGNREQGTDKKHSFAPV